MHPALSPRNSTPTAAALIGSVLGMMRDKDIVGALQRLRPLVEVWHLCNLPTARAATADRIGDSTASASLWEQAGDRCRRVEASGQTDVHGIDPLRR